MNTRSLLITVSAALLFVGVASADVTVTSDEPTDSYAVGDSFTVTTDITFDCTEEGLEAVDYKGSIVNLGDYSWLNASAPTVSYDPSGCAPGLGEITMTVEDVAIDVTVSGIAPAFVDYKLQPGLVGKTNVGGNFTIQQAYVPTFTAPTSLSFDAVAGGAVATIPLTMGANADSIFNFEVTNFSFDGVEAPAGASAHIQETLEVASGIETATGTTATSIELHFGDHGGHEMDDEHDAMEMEDEHMHWATAEAVVSVVLAAQDDGNLTSDAKLVRLTFTNTDADTMPHVEGDADEDEGGFSIPGFELVAAVGVLGAVAALRRRN